LGMGRADELNVERGRVVPLLKSVRE
jgi:hypothetical protein